MSSSYSKSVAQDQRVEIGSTGGGQFIGPGATVSQNQAYDIGTYKYQSGLTGADVLGLLENQAATSKKSADASGRFAELALTALSTASQGQSIDWRQYIPIGIVAAIAIVGLKRGRR